MIPRTHSQWKFTFVLSAGALIALALCVQCVRTYLYTDAVLIPQQAEHEAARQAGAVSAAARNAGSVDPRRLGPVLQQVIASAPDRILWTRVLDLHRTVFAQAGSPQGTPRFPSQWWDRVQKHERLGTAIETKQGEAWVVMLPLRLPRPFGPPELGSGQVEAHPGGSHPLPRDDARTAYVLEIAIPLSAVAGAFEGLRQNLLLGLIASIALLISVAVIGLRSRQYLRGKYLEAELQLAKRVQNDLAPKSQPLSPYLEFAASAVSADQVGGDFYDVFRAESGEIVIVLGDVSGKGVPAALLVSVLHGAIRSSATSQPEAACERINRMLCERTACERFATLFWAVFDPSSHTLRYVNAGHCAPLLIRRTVGGAEIFPEAIELDEGGPVLGILPMAGYSAGVVRIGDGDTLVLYSDGISEAANSEQEEFGEKRIQDALIGTAHASAAALCDRIMNQVTRFSAIDAAEIDDRTLMIVKFSAGATKGVARNTIDECTAVA